MAHGFMQALDDSLTVCDGANKSCPAFIWARKSGLPHCISGPAALIGASNFFELAVAVAISLFRLNSGATLATVVGVLVEVPLMLILVKIVNRYR